MQFVLLLFLFGVGVSLLMAASIAFTMYEVRRSNPHVFGPKSQNNPSPDR